MTVNICDSGALYGYKAAKALDNYIRSLEERKVAGLTEKQAASLIKTAKVLRTAVVHNIPRKHFTTRLFEVASRFV